MKIDQLKQIKTADGITMYMWKGKLHNTEGPAVIHPNGKKEYYINGIKLSVEEYKEAKRNTKGLPWFKGAQRKGSRV